MPRSFCAFTAAMLRRQRCSRRRCCILLQVLYAGLWWLTAIFSLKCSRVAALFLRCCRRRPFRSRKGIVTEIAQAGETGEEEGVAPFYQETRERESEEVKTSGVTATEVTSAHSTTASTTAKVGVGTGQNSLRSAVRPAAESQCSGDSSRALRKDVGSGLGGTVFVRLPFLLCGKNHRELVLYALDSRTWLFVAATAVATLLSAVCLFLLLLWRNDWDGIDATLFTVTKIHAHYSHLLTVATSVSFAYTILLLLSVGCCLLPRQFFPVALLSLPSLSQSCKDDPQALPSQSSQWMSSPSIPQCTPGARSSSCCGSQHATGADTTYNSIHRRASASGVNSAYILPNPALSHSSADSAALTARTPSGFTSKGRNLPGTRIRLAPHGDVELPAGSELCSRLRFSGTIRAAPAVAEKDPAPPDALFSKPIEEALRNASSVSIAHRRPPCSCFSGATSDKNPLASGAADPLVNSYAGGLHSSAVSPQHSVVASVLAVGESSTAKPAGHDPADWIPATEAVRENSTQLCSVGSTEAVYFLCASPKCSAAARGDPATVVPSGALPFSAAYVALGDDPEETNGKAAAYPAREEEQATQGGDRDLVCIPVPFKEEVINVSLVHMVVVIGIIAGGANIIFWTLYVGVELYYYVYFFIQFYSPFIYATLLPSVTLLLAAIILSPFCGRPSLVRVSTKAAPQPPFSPLLHSPLLHSSANFLWSAASPCAGTELPTSASCDACYAPEGCPATVQTHQQCKNNSPLPLPAGGRLSLQASTYPATGPTCRMDGEAVEVDHGRDFTAEIATSPRRRGTGEMRDEVASGTEPQEQYHFQKQHLFGEKDREPTQQRRHQRQQVFDNCFPITATVLRAAKNKSRRLAPFYCMIVVLPIWLFLLSLPFVPFFSSSPCLLRTYERQQQELPAPFHFRPPTKSAATALREEEDRRKVKRKYHSAIENEQTFIARSADLQKSPDRKSTVPHVARRGITIREAVKRAAAVAAAKNEERRLPKRWAGQNEIAFEIGKGSIEGAGKDDYVRGTQSKDTLTKRTGVDMELAQSAAEEGETTTSSASNFFLASRGARDRELAVGSPSPRKLVRVITGLSVAGGEASALKKADATTPTGQVTTNGGSNLEEAIILGKKEFVAEAPKPRTASAADGPRARRPGAALGARVAAEDEVAGEASTDTEARGRDENSDGEKAEIGELGIPSSKRRCSRPQQESGCAGHGGGAAAAAERKDAVTGERKDAGGGEAGQLEALKEVNEDAVAEGNDEAAAAEREGRPERVAAEAEAQGETRLAGDAVGGARSGNQMRRGEEEGKAAGPAPLGFSGTPKEAGADLPPEHAKKSTDSNSSQSAPQRRSWLSAEAFYKFFADVWDKARHDPFTSLPPQPLLIGHRGLPAVRPENTEASFEAAAEACDALETDVNLTTEGIVFLIHDLVFSRTTDVATVFPERANDPVYTFDWDSVRRLNAGKWWLSADPFGALSTVDDKSRRLIASQKIPQMEWLLRFAVKTKKKLVYDLECPPCNKSAWGCNGRCLNAVIELLRKTDAGNYMLWMQDRGDEIKREFPNATIVRNLPKGRFDMAAEEKRVPRAEMVNTDWRYTPASHIRQWLQAGYWVNTYVVTAPWIMSYYWCAGANSITTNDCISARKQQAPEYLYTVHAFYVFAIVFDVLCILVVSICFLLRRYSKKITNLCCGLLAVAEEEETHGETDNPTGDSRVDHTPIAAGNGNRICVAGPEHAGGNGSVPVRRRSHRCSSL